MHNFSRATGYAMARLMYKKEDGEVEDDEIPPALVEEIAAFAEKARVNLCLDNAIMTNAMMFAQPLAENWRPEWKFAYIIGLIMGAKFTVDGFHVVDIIGAIR